MKSLTDPLIQYENCHRFHHSPQRERARRRPRYMKAASKLVVAETPDNFQVDSVAVVVVVANMAVLILDEWRLVIEVPKEMSDMHARKAQREKKG